MSSIQDKTRQERILRTIKQEHQKNKEWDRKGNEEERGKKKMWRMKKIKRRKIRG
jgi:hypothetical protein